jgi:hypothetical protein
MRSWAERLEEALRHVTTGQRLIAQQRDIIKRIKAQGGDSTQSERLLAEFESSQQIFVNDLTRIRGEQPDLRNGKTPAGGDRG